MSVFIRDVQRKNTQKKGKDHVKIEAEISVIVKCLGSLRTLESERDEEWNLF